MNTLEGEILRCDICGEAVLIAKNVAGEPVALEIATEKRLVFRKDGEGNMVVVHRETWEQHQGCESMTVRAPQAS